MLLQFTNEIHNIHILIFYLPVILCFPVFVCAPVLTNYGYRLWAVTGAILTCVGLLVSAFSPNTVCFDIFYGIFGGKCAYIEAQC